MGINTGYGVTGGAGGGITGQIQVDNGPALEALDASTLVDGTCVFVRSIQAIVTLKKAPLHSYPIDSITVWPTSDAVGIWLRTYSTSEIWLERSIWAINADSGDDENDGDQSTPLRTWAELSRRLGLEAGFYAEHAVTVLIFSDIPFLTDPISGMVHIGVNGAFVIRSHESAREVLFTGVVTAKTDLSTVAPGSPATITSTWNPADYLSTDPNPDAFIVHNTTNNTWAWIAKDLGGGQAKMSPWAVQVTDTMGISGELTFGNANVGDVIEVLKLPRVGTRLTSSGGRRGLNCLSLNFLNLYPDTGVGRVSSLGAQLTVNQCRIRATSTAGNICFANGFTSDSSSAGAVLVPTDITSIVVVNAGVVTTNIAVNIVQAASALWELRGNALFQGAIMTGGRAAFIRVRNVFFEDCTQPCLQGENGAVISVSASTVCGNGNTDAILQLKGGAKCTVGGAAMAAQFLAATSGSPIKFLAATTAPAFEVATGLWTTPRNLTFVNMDAAVAVGGFGGAVLDPVSGCFLGKT
jgi:hypothetical protein